MAIQVIADCVTPGDTFVPMQLDDYDGHQHVDMAVANGASRVVRMNVVQQARAHRKKARMGIVAVLATDRDPGQRLARVLGMQYSVSCAAASVSDPILSAALGILNASVSTDILVVPVVHSARNRRVLQCLYPTHTVVLPGLQTQADKAAVLLPLRKQFPLVDRHVYWPYADHHYQRISQKAQALGYRVLPYSVGQTETHSLMACYRVGEQWGLSAAMIGMGLVHDH